MRNLKSNRFFDAKHSINLNDDDNIITVEDDKTFNELIQEEMNTILEDPDLKSIFNSIDKKISNQKLRDFREFLFEHQEILPELSDLPRLKRMLWISYLQANKEQMQKLLEVYKNAQEDINRIIVDAESETTKWEEVLAIFHARFHVPFRVRIENKVDSVLGRGIPVFFYDFEDCEDRIEQDLLLRVLSRGEGRALYLLNIIFEIQSRKATGQDTLLIIDDIADSFDYQNKYAIVEYLKDLAEDSSFKMIIMTHNFDFFRTVQSRVDPLAWVGSYIAERTNGQIDFVPVKGGEVNTPFKSWREDLSDPVKLLASIPFARNIAEYIGDKICCGKLTAFLHIKQETYNLNIGDLEVLYGDLFSDIMKSRLDADKKVIELLFEQADILTEEPIENGINLEKKVVLSMAIRLKAEEYMIKKIDNNEWVSKISGNQTGKLFGKFKKQFGSDYDAIEIIGKVCLMTPENIHLNSFMFEPIIDMSDRHLRELYQEVAALDKVAAEV